MVAAAEQDKDPDQTHWQHEKALAIGRSQRLAHLIGTNGFFSALVAEGRHRDDCALSVWWSERFTVSNFNGIVRPDGVGIWEERGAQVTFCLEYDRSTETLERLDKKLPELRGPPDRQRLRLLGSVLFRSPPPRGRCPAGPGRSHRPRGDGGTRADPAAARGHLGAHRLRRMPVAPGRAGRCAHPPESYQRIEETRKHRRRYDEHRRRDQPDRYGQH
jgi:hypothetical protein